MSVLIRPATPDDADLVSGILAASYPPLLASAYGADLLARTLPVMTRANPKLLASGTYHLAFIDEDAAGCGGWSFERPGSGEIEPGLAHIRHFAVRAESAGRGVGRALYERCAAEARAAGATAFECYATLNGEPFYAALGFTPISLLDVPMTPDAALPSRVMRRAL